MWSLGPFTVPSLLPSFQLPTCTGICPAYKPVCMLLYWSCLLLSCPSAPLCLIGVHTLPVCGQSSLALLLCSTYPGIAYSQNIISTAVSSPDMELKWKALVEWVMVWPITTISLYKWEHLLFSKTLSLNWKAPGWQSGVVTVGCPLSQDHSLITCFVLRGQEWSKDVPVLGFLGVCMGGGWASEPQKSSR